MRRASRIDGNQRTMDALARRLGAEVIPVTSAPDVGFDRLYVRDKVYIAEIKDPAQPPNKRRLTEGEAKRKAAVEAAGGVYHILETDDDMLRMFGLKP